MPELNYRCLFCEDAAMFTVESTRPTGTVVRNVCWKPHHILQVCEILFDTDVRTYPAKVVFTNLVPKEEWN